MWHVQVLGQVVFLLERLWLSCGVHLAKLSTLILSTMLCVLFCYLFFISCEILFILVFYLSVKLQYVITSGMKVMFLPQLVGWFVRWLPKKVYYYYYYIIVHEVQIKNKKGKLNKNKNTDTCTQTHILPLLEWVHVSGGEPEQSGSKIYWAEGWVGLEKGAWSGRSRSGRGAVSGDHRNGL